MPGDCGAGDRATYLALAREPEVSAVTLMCLAREKDGATAEAYLNGTPIDDPDRDRRDRHFRNAVSLMVALGDAAIDPLCNHLFDSRDDVRHVAAQALAYLSAPRAIACLTSALRADGAGTRATAASVLKTLLSREQLPSARAWQLVTRLLADPDPAVRVEALRLLRFFNSGVALPAAERAQRDPDPRVKEEAAAAVINVEGMRRLQLGR